MKVIKPGRAQKGWSKKCTCTGAGNQGGGCGATLLVEQADLFQTTSNARDETTYYVTFKCAACGVLTDIEGAPSVPGGYPTQKAEQRRSEGR